MTMSTVGRALLLSLVLPTCAQAQTQTDALTRARQFYNLQQFDDAILVAGDARRVPALADAAAVIFARAHLERYRAQSEPADLSDAREALLAIQDAKLSARDHMELVVGLGELLFFDKRFGAAAVFFEIALGHLDLLEPGARESLLEWWAGSLDQQAQLEAETERKPIYLRMLGRVEDELRRDDRSAVASYWLAAAARGTSDLDRAWSAAVAGWVRGPFLGAAGVKLRADLDRLVKNVLIPERAQQLSAGADPRPMVAVLQQEWDEVKESYGKRENGNR
jgi:hypothetical protein